MAAVSQLVLLVLLLKLPLLLLLLLQAWAGRLPAGEASALTCGFACAMPWPPAGVSVLVLLLRLLKLPLLTATKLER